MSTTTIIGKILPDGQVKYIRCSDRESLRVTARILLRFYRRESRLDALLELGNVQYLGPSPYGRSAGPADEVHCIACIRDNNESEQEYRSEIITGKEIFLKANCPAFLYEQGRWLLAWEKAFIPISNPCDVPLIKWMLYHGLKYISISTDKERAKQNGNIQNFAFQSWDAMCKQAVSDGDTYYIFRSGKLVATINSQQSIKTPCHYE